MKDGNFNTIFDIIEIIAGIYVIYAGIRMKNTGVISSQLVGKDIDLISPRDPKGFIKKMFPVNMVCGAIFIFLGSLSLYFDLFLNVELWMNLSVTGALFATCLVFAMMTKISQDRYLK